MSSGWTFREGLSEVERRLSQEIESRKKREEVPEDQKWSPITFLRRYSNYLTPETGLLSLDTWTAVATYCRNLVLNLSIIALALGTILIFPRLMVELFLIVRGWSEAGALDLDAVLVLPAGLLVMLALYSTTVNLRGEGGHQHPGAVQRRVVVPLVLAAIGIGLWTPSGKLALIGDPLSWLPNGLLDVEALGSTARP